MCVIFQIGKVSIVILANPYILCPKTKRIKKTKQAHSINVGFYPGNSKMFCQRGLLLLSKTERKENKQGLFLNVQNDNMIKKKVFVLLIYFGKKSKNVRQFFYFFGNIMSAKCCNRW